MTARCYTKRAIIGSKQEALAILESNLLRRHSKPPHVERCPYCGGWHIVGDNSRLVK